MSWVQQDDSPDVALIVPNRGTVSFEWASRLAILDMPTYLLSSQKTSPIDLAREQSVENAFQKGVEWFFFLDSDVIPPKDVFARLRRHNLDFVSGIYYARKDPIRPAAWTLTDQDELTPLKEWGDNEIIHVDAVGLGCSLIHRRVFEKIDRPWFRWTSGYEPHPWDGRVSGGETGVGEDFYFCHKVKEAGFNIYLDTSFECPHETSGVVTEDGVIPIEKAVAEGNDE